MMDDFTNERLYALCRVAHSQPCWGGVKWQQPPVWAASPGCAQLTNISEFFAQLPGQVKEPKASGWLDGLMSHIAESLQSLLRLDSKIQRKLSKVL